MSERDPKKVARQLFDRAYRAQMEGELEVAELLYQRSIDVFPTAEAFTFLGWTRSFEGKYDEAIELCKKAIELDPDFGNPYNDIGAYLIEMGNLDEAIGWLEKATQAPRYDAVHYAYSNLGRVYVSKELLTRAREMFERALEFEPDYEPAREAIERIRRSLN